MRYRGAGCACFILCTTAALAAPARPGHILMYAPGDSQACRLALAQIISQIGCFVLMQVTAGRITFVAARFIAQ
ncbi:hypothetical protein C1Y42_12715 [Pantoea sp. ICBG 985]|nr:hypothetical protein C1Y42_12715 [Pantoea sp. ICBG 985]